MKSSKLTREKKNISYEDVVSSTTPFSNGNREDILINYSFQELEKSGVL